MTTEHSEEPLDAFAERLIGYDEALAAGSTPRPGLETPEDLDPELVRRLDRARHCVQLIERVRRWQPDSLASFAESVSEEGDLDEPAEPPATIGRFRIVRELGHGGYGVVFLAVDPDLEREVALKVPRPQVMLSAELRNRFLREGKAAASLSYANIVSVYEVGRVGALFYIASAYCEGVSLAAWLHSQERPPAPGVAAQLVQVLAEAAQHAHSRGVVHRDLKPSNVLLQKNPTEGNEGNKGRQATSESSHSPGTSSFPSLPSVQSFVPKIADFGLAKVVRSNDDETRHGAILGTPSYMAPEQAAGRPEDVGPAADIHALGAILYELLTGRPPFRKDTDLATLRAVELEEPNALRRLRKDVPRDLEAICLRCLEKKPEQRYASASDLAADLQRFLNGEPVKARRISSAERLGRWCRRNPRLALLSGSLLALLLTIAVGASLATLVLQRQGKELRETLDRAQTAEKEASGAALLAQRRLYDSLRSEMQARRVTGQPGQRLDTLKAATEAAGLLELLQLGDQERLDLRNQTIATLQLIDLEPVRHWPVPAFARGAFDADMKHQAHSLEGGKTIVVRELSSNQERARLHSERPATRLCFSPNGQLLAAHLGPVLRVWSIQDPAVPWDLPVAEGSYFTCFDFSPDSRRLAVVEADGALVIHDVPSRKPVQRLEKARVDTPPKAPLLFDLRMPPYARLLYAHQPHYAGSPSSPPGPTAICFDPSGEKLAVFRARHVEIINLAGGKPLRFSQFLEPVLHMAWSPDGKHLALACADQMVYVVSHLAEPFLLLAGHESLVLHVAFDPSGDLLASSSYDNSTLLWSMRDHRRLMRLEGRAPRFSGDGQRLGLFDTNRNLVLEGRIHRPLEHQLVRHGSSLGTQPCLETGPDGRLLAVTSRNHPSFSTTFLDFQAAQARSTRVTGAVVLHTPHPLLLTRSREKYHRQTITLTDSPDAALVHLGSPQEIPLLAGAVIDEVLPSSDHRKLMVRARLSGLDESQPTKKNVLALLDVETGALRSLSADWQSTVSPCGSWRVTRITGKGVGIYNHSNGKLVLELPLPLSARFSLDGKLLAVLRSNRCDLLRTGSWEVLQSIPTESSSYSSSRVALSSDNRTLALVVSRGTIELFDVQKHDKLATLSLSKTDELSGVAFTPDSARLFAVTPEGTIHVIDLARMRHQLALRNLDWD